MKKITRSSRQDNAVYLYIHCNPVCDGIKEKIKNRAIAALYWDEELTMIKSREYALEGIQRPSL